MAIIIVIIITIIIPVLRPAVRVPTGSLPLVLCVTSTPKSSKVFTMWGSLLCILSSVASKALCNTLWPSLLKWFMSAPWSRIRKSTNHCGDHSKWGKGKKKRREEKKRIDTRDMRYLAIFCIFWSSCFDKGPNKRHSCMRGVAPLLSSSWISDWSDFTTNCIKSKSGTENRWVTRISTCVTRHTNMKKCMAFRITIRRKWATKPLH